MLKPQTYGKFRVEDNSRGTFLFVNDTVISTNAPDEIEGMQEFADNCCGDVLVAGLGLGIIVDLLLNNSKVDQITVFENDIELINMFLENNVYTNERVHLRFTNVFWANAINTHFDFGFFDIWHDRKIKIWFEMELLKEKYAKYVDNIHVHKYDLLQKWRKENSEAKKWQTSHCQA